jgi:hypothetical protein
MSFYNGGIIDSEVDPENQLFRLVGSLLMKIATNSIIHSFSDESSAVVVNSIQELGTYALPGQFRSV